MSLKESAERAHATLDRVAGVVVAVARGLALASFGASVVIAAALLLELEERPAHWVIAIVVLALVLSIPGWVLLVFRAAVTSVREVPGVVVKWQQKARVHYGRLTTADSSIGTGVAAAKAFWEGGRDASAVRAGLGAIRLSFLIAALICAVLVWAEIALALAVLVATALF